MVTILSYIIVRLFVPKKNYYLEGDELRYMATAKNFYKLWNRSFYDTHPPLYAWLIKYLKSGIMVSFLCSILLYYVSYLLYSALGLSPYQRIVALTFLTFNYTLIYYSNRTFRYQLIALLGTLTIYLLVVNNWFGAGVAWGLLGLTCSFAGLRGFFIWLMFPHWLTLVTFGAVYSSWIMDKVKIYCDHEYYPSGIDGKIERVKDFTIKQLFSPLYFDWNYAYYGKRELGYDFKNWLKKVGGVFGLYPPLTLLVPVALFFTIKGALVSPLWISLIVVCLLYPSLLKRFLPRNSIIAIPLLGFLLAKGLPIVPLEWVFLGSIGLVVGFLWFNRAFLLTKPKIKARVTSHFLDNLPKDGVLVEGLIAYPIAYRSHKRVVVLPHNPNKEDAIFQTNLSIKKFDLNYIVISDLWKTEAHLGYPAVKYIQTSKIYRSGETFENKFKLIKTIKEDGDIYYIYQVN